MGRRLIGFPVRRLEGPVLPGSPTQIRFYSDAALTTLKTRYANAVDGTSLTNPATPNSGKQTTLQVGHPIVPADTIIWVVDVAGFNVGDYVPIYDGTNTAYRAITAIDGVNRKLTVDTAVGFNFAVNNTFIGNLDMSGHVGGYFDDGTDTFLQSKNVASARVLPPLQVPTLVPTAVIAIQEEGAAVASRAILNFQGIGTKATDDVPNGRVNISQWRHDLWTVGVL